MRDYIFFLKTGALVRLVGGDGRGAQGSSALGGWSLGLAGSCVCMYPEVAQPGVEPLGGEKKLKRNKL